MRFREYGPVAKMGVQVEGKIATPSPEALGMVWGNGLGLFGGWCGAVLVMVLACLGDGMVVF